MTPEEIKQEANNLRKKAEECEYFTTTLTYEHQNSVKTELESKARELRELQKEYERLLDNTPKHQTLKTQINF